MEISKEEIGKVIKFTKKPVEIEAIQWTGKNINDVLNFMGWRNAEHDTRTGLGIFTLEGRMQANEGDWIIKGIQGEFYPCKPDIFEKTYQVSSTTPQSVEMSLEECKDQVARGIGFNSWSDMMVKYTPSQDYLFVLNERALKLQLSITLKKAEQLEKENSSLREALPKWIPIKGISDLPKTEGQYLVRSNCDWHPYYRHDVFCGRLTNSINETTGESIYTHYCYIQFPEALQSTETKY